MCEPNGDPPPGGREFESSDGPAMATGARGGAGAAHAPASPPSARGALIQPLQAAKTLACCPVLGAARAAPPGSGAAMTPGSPAWRAAMASLAVVWCSQPITGLHQWRGRCGRFHNNLPTVGSLAGGSGGRREAIPAGSAGIERERRAGEAGGGALKAVREGAGPGSQAAGCHPQRTKPLRHPPTDMVGRRWSSRAALRRDSSQRGPS